MDSPVVQTVQDFFGQYPTKQFAKGQIIIWAEHDPEHIYYLVSGRVRQCYIFEDGERVVVNVFRPGAFFTMSWAINHTPNRYFFEALDDVEVRGAPVDTTLEFVRSQPTIVLDLLSRVYRGTDGMLERMTYLMASDTEKRLVFELVTECKRSRPTGNSALVTLNEVELGLQTGLARETISRHMRKLKLAGLVEVSAKGVQVHDIAGLEKLLL